MLFKEVIIQGGSDGLGGPSGNLGLLVLIWGLLHIIALLYNTACPID